MSGIRRGLLTRFPAFVVGAVACVGMLAALGPVAPARGDGGGGSLPPAAARAVREARARKDPARLAAAAKAARPVVEPVVPAAARSAEPDGLVASGVWGSSPWEYRVENGQRVLTVHAGTLGKTVPPSEWDSGDSVADVLPDKGSGLSVIRIDPGVAAAYGSSLFAGLPSLLRIEGGGNLDVSKVTSTEAMFEDDVALQSVDVGDWDMSNVINAAAMFKNCRSLRSLDVGNWNTSKVAVTGLGGYDDDRGDLQYDEDAVGYATSGMFENDSMLTFLDVGRWDVGALVNTNGMFKGDTSLRYLDVSHWNTKPLSYSNRMFEHDAMLDNLDTSGWSLYSNEAATYMFRDCRSLKYINLDHIAAYNSAFDSMVYMFADDPSLVSVDMSYSEYSAVKYIGHMFANDPALVSVNMSHTSFDELRRADYMFAGDKSLTDFTFNGQKPMGFETGSLYGPRLEHMFDGASSLSYLDLSALSSASPEENPPYTHVHSEGMFAGATSLHTLVVPRDAYRWMANSGLPDVPAAGSRVPEWSQVVASSRWVALNGSAKGSMYTSQQLMDMGPRPEATVYQWDMRDA
ncbi:MAG: BspA family leucine-rich repeat surface protein [Bifidobacterium asteroides]